MIINHNVLIVIFLNYKWSMLVSTRQFGIVRGDVIISMKGANMDIGSYRAIGVMLKRWRAWILECVDPRGRGSLRARWSCVVLHGWDIKTTKEVVEAQRAVRFVGFRRGILRCLFIVRNIQNLT